MCTKMLTTPLNDKAGHVFAPLGNGFVKGKHIPIEVTGISPDSNTPLNIREALVGISVCTICDRSESLFAHYPPGSRIGYIPEIVEALLKAGKDDVAHELESLCPHFSQVYVFEPGTFKSLRP